MSDFETIECEHCGETFEAHPSARAAQTGYCSPKCQTEATAT